MFDVRFEALGIHAQKSASFWPFRERTDVTFRALTCRCCLLLWPITSHCWFADSLTSYNLLSIITRLLIPQDGYFYNCYTAFFFFQHGKQHWQGEDRSDDNNHNINFNARNSSKQRNERRFSNPHRKEDYRSFDERQFESKRSSFYPRKGNKKFTSDRGFQFNNESRRKNPQYLKRYTFWILVAVHFLN